MSSQSPEGSIKPSNLVDRLPGWALMAVVAALSMPLSKSITIGGNHPVEAAVLAILIGVGLRNMGLLPAFFLPGIKAFEKPLVLGIVLIGSSLNFGQLMQHGSAVFSIVFGTMFVGFVGIYVTARMLSLSPRLGLLLTVGTTICGGTAIAIIAPIIEAREEETSYAIGTIALWGLLAILLYPLVAHSLGVSDFSFGVFAGTAIHSTPQVVGAGFIFSDEAGRIATAVKLIRNCFIAPLALGIAYWYSKSALAGETGVSTRKAFPWFLFGFFVMAWLSTQGIFSTTIVSKLTEAGKFLVLIGMVGVGLNTHLAAFKKVGLTPLLVGMIGALLVAGCSVTMITLFT